MAAIPFIDLHAQRRRLGGRIEAAIARVVEHGAYLMGPEVFELERRIAAYVGVRHAISCASGTDALYLILLAEGIGPGDAVFMPGFTFAGTAEAAVLLGATPVFVDVGDDFNLDPDHLAAAVEPVAAEGRLRPRAVLPVDLYGLPADYPAIHAIAAEHGLFVLQDAAQSFGAERFGRRAGAHGHAAATSFYPSKPLGAYGDGGCVFTDDDGLAETVRSLRVHGQGPGGAYDHVRVGLTARLDTIQAAVLLEKLAILDEELTSRARVAARYGSGLRHLARVPRVPGDARPAWGQYTLVLDDDGGRDRLATALRARGVPTAVHYPAALADQPAYRDCPIGPGGLERARDLARRVLSLPMHPYLERPVQGRIVREVAGLLTPVAEEAEARPVPAVAAFSAG